MHLLVPAGKAALAAVAAGGVPPTEEPDDVAAERARVEGLSDYEAHPIVVRQLNKTYPGLDGQPPKVRRLGAVSWGVDGFVWIRSACTKARGLR
jgi:hypothetical protein